MAVLEIPVVTPLSAEPTDDEIRDDIERIYVALVRRWEKRKVEIVDGRIVVRSVVTFKHGMTANRLYELIREPMRERGWVSPDDIALYLGSQADRYRPDRTVTVGQPRLWGDDHAFGADTRLVAEVVSEGTGDDDYEIKPTNCAKGGVPLYLLIDTFDEIVKLFNEPSEKGYARMVEVRLGEPLDLPDPWNITIDTAQLTLP